MEELIFYNMKPLLYQKFGETSTPSRYVTKYEIEYQLCDGGLCHIDEQAFHVKAGQLLFAKPGMTRSTTGSYQCLALHFSCHNEALSSKLSHLPSLITSPSPHSESIKKLLRTAYYAQMNPESQLLRLEGMLFQILAEYIDASQIIDSVPPQHQRYAEGIFQSVDYMQKHFSEHITCDQLAAQMFISTNFYQKLFKKIMNTSPAKHLYDIRISEACRLLANTDLSIQEIAEQCGFNCASYFIYVFRKQFSTTPLEYRKKNKILL